MRHLFLLTLVLMLLVAAAGCASDTDRDGLPEMTGLIFAVEDGRILVVQGIEGTGISYDEWFEAGKRAAWFAVTDKTLIMSGGNKVPAEALAVGQNVEVWATGPMMESYPEQGEARKIVILED